jgi:hypothetical protein
MVTVIKMDALTLAVGTDQKGRGGGSAFVLRSQMGFLYQSQVVDVCRAVVGL